MSNQLHDLQHCFQQALLGDSDAIPAMQALIADGHGLAATARLAIYQNAYRQRLRQALGEAFDKTHALVGDDLFGQLCEGFITAHPSVHGNLRWFGEHFAHYVAEALPAHPCVAELARFEWSLGLAFDAADGPALTLAALGTLRDEDWERVGFTLSPSLQWLALEWNTCAIWLALEQGMTPPVPEQEPASWLVWRKGLQPHFRSTTSLEATALRELAAGMPFAAVCAQAMDTSDAPDLTTQVAGWLQAWIADEVLSAVRLPG